MPTLSIPFLFSFWSLDFNKHSQISTALLFFFLFIFALLWLQSKFQHPPLPPGPRGLPLLGYLPFLSTNLHHTFNNLAKIREVRKIIKGVLESAGTPIDISKLSLMAAVKSVMAMTWGGSRGLIGVDGADLEAKFMEVVNELMVLLGTPNLSDLFPVLGGLDLQGIGRKMKKVMNVFDGIFNSAIEEQRKRGGDGMENRGFLQLLLEVMEGEDSSESITDKELKALLVVCFPNYLSFHCHSNMLFFTLK
uniref:Uncharacterized protein n=1 Tax=Cucumis sativus TaxID=3659 RepID=A0A0A0KKI4_CUCSA